METEKTINLFIIEDNVVYSTALRHYLLNELEKVGYEVLIQNFRNAENTLEYLDCKNSIMPDVVILDYFLNSQYFDAMNGLSALFRLKCYNPEVETIFLSVQTDMEVTIQSMRTGAFDYVIKDQNAFKKVLLSLLGCLRKMEKDGKLNPGVRRKSVSL